MARRYWPGEDALGRRFRIGELGAGGWRLWESRATSSTTTCGTRRIPEFYVLYRQVPWTFMSVVVETPARPDAVVADVRRALAGIDPDSPVPTLRPMAELVRLLVSLDQFEMLLLAILPSRVSRWCWRPWGCTA